MKKISRILATTMLASSVLACLASCGGKGSQAGVLDITYYNGGYGEVWLEEACKEYKKLNPDFKYNLVPETDGTCNSSSLLSSGKNLPDIIMSNNSGFYEYVTKGYIEPLDEVYSAEVETSQGKQTIYNYMTEIVREVYYRQEVPGQTEDRPWALPWTVLPCAMVVNSTILKSTSHTESSFSVGADKIENGKWVKAPETVSELLAYFADINARNDKTVPFGWPGTGVNYFFFALYQWWAEDQGLTVSNYQGEGSWYDFWNYGNTQTDLSEPQTLSLSVFEQTGQKTAIDTLRSLIIDEKGNFKNSPDKVASLSIQQIEQAFVQGKIAIAFGSSFLENEMKNFINDKTDDFKFMNVPSLDSYKGSEKYCYVNTGEITYIPRRATDKDLAKEFLVFLASEAQNVAFTQRTGSIRPFDYNAIEIAPDYAWTDFNRSVFEVYTNSEKLVEYPKNVKDKDFVSYVYRYTNQMMFGSMALSDVLLALKSQDGETLMNTVKSETKEAFEGYVIKYGMELI